MFRRSPLYTIGQTRLQYVEEKTIVIEVSDGNQMMPLTYCYERVRERNLEMFPFNEITPSLANI